MKHFVYIQALFVAICVSLGTGCATQYTAMVRVTPRDAWDPRTSDQLYRDLTRTAPVAIPPGDFVVNKANDGPSCWIALGDARQTDKLVRALRNSNEWTVTSVAKVNASARRNFGLAANAGAPTPGTSHQVYQPTILASR